MASQTSAKKRKRADSSSDHLVVSLHDKTPSAVGPVLATFPALDPPKSTPFSLYTPPRSPGRVNTNLNQNVNQDSFAGTKSNTDQQNGEEFAQRHLLLAGETESIEFYSTGESEVVREGGCRYLVGIRNKRTNTLLLRPAPLQILGRRVKALKSLAPPASSSLPATEHNERQEKRAELGEAFGTKKAQKAIRATERNKIDVSAMEDVVGHIQESVESGTRGLPTQEEAKQLLDATRQIPKFDQSATRPEDVYKLHDIVSSAELHAVPIKHLLSAGSQQERMRNVPGPFARSEWMKQHVERVFNQEKPSKKTLRILLYIAILLTFRAGAPRYCSKRSDLEERLPGVPSVVIDGIYSRFTETIRGSSATKFTTDNAVRLLTHVCALCLHVDNFATDTTIIAADLKEPVTRINQHFKLLGCKIEKLSMTETSRLGLNDTTSTTAGGHKRAVLRVPLEFPKARMKRRG